MKASNVKLKSYKVHSTSKQQMLPTLLSQDFAQKFVRMLVWMIEQHVQKFSLRSLPVQKLLLSSA